MFGQALSWELGVHPSFSFWFEHRGQSELVVLREPARHALCQPLLTVVGLPVFRDEIIHHGSAGGVALAVLLVIGIRPSCRWVLQGAFGNQWRVRCMAAAIAKVLGTLFEYRWRGLLRCSGRGDAGAFLTGSVSGQRRFDR